MGLTTPCANCFSIHGQFLDLTWIFLFFGGGREGWMQGSKKIRYFFLFWGRGEGGGECRVGKKITTHIRKYAQPIPIPPNTNYERISLGSLLEKGFFFSGCVAVRCVETINLRRVSLEDSGDMDSADWGCEITWNWKKRESLESCFFPCRKWCKIPWKKGHEPLVKLMTLMPNQWWSMKMDPFTPNTGDNLVPLIAVS